MLKKFFTAVGNILCFWANPAEASENEGFLEAVHERN